MTEAYAQEVNMQGRHSTVKIYLNEHIRPLLVSLLIVTTLMVTSVGAAGAGSRLRLTPTPTNVDVSQRHGSESEETVAVNPTNSNNIVIVTNVDHPAAGLFEGVSFNGGRTWTTKLIGDNDNLKDACCDPSLSFDNYGNLFLAYLFNVEDTLPIALSTDGGLHFHLVANIPGIAKRNGKGAQEKGLFHFVDQPTITAAEGEAWAVVNVGGPMGAFGAK